MDTPARRASDNLHIPKYRLIIPIVLVIFTAAGMFVSSKYDFDLSALGHAEEKMSAPAPAATAMLPSPTAVPNVGAPAPVLENRARTWSPEAVKARREYDTEQRKWYVQAGFSLLMALASVFIILSKRYPDESTNKWAYSTIAFLLGFWLK